MSTTAIILAAGQGTRMKSALPKVLHRLCGRAMVDFVVEAALDAGCHDAIVVVGHRREEVEAHLKARFGDRVRTAVQEEQNGTGHAVLCAVPALTDAAKAAMLLMGDTPLVRSEDLARMAEARGGNALSMLTTRVADPTGYGRIVREEGRIARIVEHRDCTEEQRRIEEINPAMYVARVDFLREALGGLTTDNDQGELYLTDIVATAAKAGVVAGVEAEAATLVGINDRSQLAAAEDDMYRRIGDGLRKAGATIRTSARIDAGVDVGRDARIEHGAVLRGATSIGEGAVVDVGAVLDDVTVAAGAHVKPYTVARESAIGEKASVGPFTHVRPKSVLEEGVKVGNFVELKKTTMRKGAKAGHLAYLGDGDIGPEANIGAGTIFCNYDGFNKHQTVIEEGAFIGSDSQIVAPVTIGAGAYVGTGTTVTKSVPADALAIGRVKQENKEGYASRLKARLEAAKKAKLAKG